NEAGNDGLLAGNAKQLGVQALACAATGIYAAVVTYVVLKIINAIVGLRASDNDEREGLDTSQHGEEAYAPETMGTQAPEEIMEAAASAMAPVIREEATS